MEIDVATKELLILDSEERGQLGGPPLCVPRMASCPVEERPGQFQVIPLVPLVVVTLISVSAAVTLLVSRTRAEKKLRLGI